MMSHNFQRQNPNTVTLCVIDVFQKPFRTSYFFPERVLLFHALSHQACRIRSCTAQTTGLRLLSALSVEF